MQPPMVGAASPPTLAAIALGHAWEWSRAVSMQIERFRRSGSVSDTYLIVIALRNVLRAAELARDHALTTDAGRGVIAEAIAAFEDALPGAKGARDVLEHFDDYARGHGGRLGGRGALGPYHTDIVGFGGQHAETGFPQELVLRIGPHAVALTAAPAACAALVDAIYVASRGEELGARDP